MSKALHRNQASPRFAARSGLGIALALLVSALIPQSSAHATAAVPLDPVTTFNCPGGGSYDVDANGVASRGGTGQYVDSSGTVLPAGNCGGNLTLDSSVRRIEEFAFASAPLTGLILPNQLVSIGRGAFSDTQLTTLSIPNSVTTIETAAFSLVRLSTLQLGTSLITIGGSAFKDSVLDSLVIPNSVMTIGGHAFESSPLTSLIINSPSLTIGSAAFSATATSNLPCFYNLGDAVLSSAALQSAALPPACPVANPAPVVPAPAPATPVITSTPEATPSASPPPTPVPSPTASPTPVTPAPAVVSFSFRVAGFEPGSATLTSATKQSLSRQAGKLSSAKRIVVTGFSEGPRVLKSDYALSLKRAKTIQAYLQRMLGTGVRITVANIQSTQVGSHYRAVQISVVR